MGWLAIAELIFRILANMDCPDNEKRNGIRNPGRIPKLRITLAVRSAGGNRDDVRQAMDMVESCRNCTDEDITEILAISQQVAVNGINSAMFADDGAGPAIA